MTTRTRIPVYVLFAAPWKSPCARSWKTPAETAPWCSIKVKQNSGNYGFNASTDEYGDMIEMGILDPTKVSSYCFAERCFYRRSHDHHRSHGGRTSGRQSGRRHAWWRRHG